MVRDYSQGASITEAIQRTLSGSSPCLMCKRITAEQQKEEKSPVCAKLEKKSEVFRSRREICQASRNAKIFLTPLRAQRLSLSDAKLRQPQFPSSPDYVKSKALLPKPLR
jgi:hypothetical protein